MAGTERGARKGREDAKWNADGGRGPMDEDAAERTEADVQLAQTDKRAEQCARVIAIDRDGWEGRAERLARSLAKSCGDGAALSLILTATIERAVSDLNVNERRRGEARARVARLQEELLPTLVVRCPARRAVRWLVNLALPGR